MSFREKGFAIVGALVGLGSVAPTVLRELDISRRPTAVVQPLSDLDERVRLQPEEPSSYVDRGKAYIDKGQYERAIADFDRAIQFAPRNPNAYLWRSFAREKLGDVRGAAADREATFNLARQLEVVPSTIGSGLQIRPQINERLK